VRGLLLLGAASIAGGACHDDSTKSFRFEDTESRAFTAKCPQTGKGTKEYDCEWSVTSTEPPRPTGKPEPGSRAGYKLIAGYQRYMKVCDSWIKEDKNGRGATSGNCRIVTCRSAADCPPSSPLLRPTCMNGLCGDPTQDLDGDDLRALCIAGTGPLVDSPEQKRRLEAAENGCGPDGTDPCTVPAICRQP
jgi:hypothetical protein